MILIAAKMILWLCSTVHKAGGFWHQTCQHSSQPRWLSWSYFLFPFVVYAIWKFVGLVQNATICPEMSPKNPTGILDFASLDLTTSCSHCSLAVLVAASGEGFFIFFLPLMCQFSNQPNLRQAMVLYPGGVPCPAQLYLEENVCV